MTDPDPIAVLLIPGFFGYGSFGPANAPLLEYFAGVNAVLTNALPAHYRIMTHEPPPTGTLDERVASLHDAVWKLLRGEPLPHARETIKAERVHLVGHSTGGLDARLLANPKFRWVGGPIGEERLMAIQAIGKIITISAPFKGTPLVSHVRVLRDAFLAAVSDLTMLGTFRNSRLDAFFLRWLTAGADMLRLSPLFAVPEDIVARAAGSAVQTPAPNEGDADDVAAQVQSFLNKLHEDRQLFDDLSVDHMTDVNKKIAGGDALSRISSYVTVSPKPPFIDVGGEQLGRIVYRILYDATARDPLRGAPPTGSPLGPITKVTSALNPGVSCDGVVPTRSQTLGGAAARVVFADHLDVVGSFRGGSGADVMRSRSDFSKERFVELWGDIAARLIAADQRLPS